MLSKGLGIRILTGISGGGLPVAIFQSSVMREAQLGCAERSGFWVGGRNQRFDCGREKGWAAGAGRSPLAARPPRGRPWRGTPVAPLRRGDVAGAAARAFPFPLPPPSGSILRVEETRSVTKWRRSVLRRALAWGRKSLGKAGKKVPRLLRAYE